MIRWVMRLWSRPPVDRSDDAEREQARHRAQQLDIASKQLQADLRAMQAAVQRTDRAQ